MAEFEFWEDVLYMQVNSYIIMFDIKFA